MVSNFNIPAPWNQSLLQSNLTEWSCVEKVVPLLQQLQQKLLQQLQQQLQQQLLQKLQQQLLQKLLQQLRQQLQLQDRILQLRLQQHRLQQHQLRRNLHLLLSNQQELQVFTNLLIGHFTRRSIHAVMFSFSVCVCLYVRPSVI